MNEKVDLLVHAKLSAVVGLGFPMPQTYQNWPKSFRFLWKLFEYLAYVIMIVELMSQAMQISNSFNQIEILLTCVLSSVYVVQFLCKVLVLKIKKKTFDFTFREMSEISKSLMKNPLKDEKFIEFFDNYYTKALKFGFWKGTLQLICNIGLNILFITLSWIGMKRETTAGLSWTPFDSTKNPGYTFTCIFEMLCFVFVNARTAVLDLLFWEMIIIPSVHLQYLRHLLTIIVKDENNDLSNNKGSFVLFNNFQNKFYEQTLCSRLKWWVEHHQRVLRMMQRFGSLASAFLAVNYLASLVDLFLSGYVAISSSHWDIFQRILINAIVITDVFQLYVVSLAGDKLRENSENVAVDGTSIVIFQVNKKIRQIFLLIFESTYRPIQIRFGGINPLSSQTFSKLIQLTFSYFVTIVRLKQSKQSVLKQ